MRSSSIARDTAIRRLPGNRVDFGYGEVDLYAISDWDPKHGSIPARAVPGPPSLSGSSIPPERIEPPPHALGQHPYGADHDRVRARGVLRSRKRC